MDTPLHRRDIPEGYTIEQDNSLWHVGFVFRWSEVEQAYVDQLCRITVRPNETVGEAFFRQRGEQMYPDYDVFFAEFDNIEVPRGTRCPEDRPLPVRCYGKQKWHPTVLAWRRRNRQP